MLLGSLQRYVWVQEVGGWGPFMWLSHQSGWYQNFLRKAAPIFSLRCPTMGLNSFSPETLGWRNEGGRRGGSYIKWLINEWKDDNKLSALSQSCSIIMRLLLQPPTHPPTLPPICVIIRAEASAWFSSKQQPEQVEVKRVGAYQLCITWLPLCNYNLFSSHKTAGIDDLSHPLCIPSEPDTVLTLRSWQSL